MSIFASLVTKVLQVQDPDEPGQTITIRKLAPKHLRAARKASQLSSIADLREIGGQAFLREMQALTVAATTVPSVVVAAEAAEADPMILYDAMTLIANGVIEWSYVDRPLATASFEDMNEDVQEWLAREVLKLSKPSLFQSSVDAKADQKKGDGVASLA